MSTDALEISSSRSSPPVEDLQEALPTLRIWLAKHCGMPADAIVRSAVVVTKLNEDGVNTYTLELTYAG